MSAPEQRMPNIANGALQLAAQILLDDSSFPRFSLSRSTVSHWNGVEVDVDFADIVVLIDCGLIDLAGRWTDAGETHLAIVAIEVAIRKHGRRSHR